MSLVLRSVRFYTDFLFSPAPISFRQRRAGPANKAAVARGRDFRCCRQLLSALGASLRGFGSSGGSGRAPFRLVSNDQAPCADLSLAHHER